MTELQNNVFFNAMYGYAANQFKCSMDEIALADIDDYDYHMAKSDEHIRNCNCAMQMIEEWKEQNA